MSSKGASVLATAPVGTTYPAPRTIQQSALLQSFEAEYQRSINHPEAFWAEQASKFQWSRPWSKILENPGPHHRWFTGAKTNITINALDRHANSDHANRVAYIWLGENGEERAVT